LLATLILTLVYQYLTWHHGPLLFLPSQATPFDDSRFLDPRPLA